MTQTKHPPYISVSMSPNGNIIQSPKMVEVSLFLKEAIKKDDIQTIHQMKSYNINFNDAALNNPLKQAIKKGHINCIRALLTCGTSPLEYSKQKPYNNPYCYAVALGTQEMIESMLDHHTPNTELIAAMLDMAIREKRPEKIRFMFERGLFDYFETQDDALQTLVQHPTRHFPGKTREFVMALYDKKEIDLKDFDLDGDEPMLTALEMEKEAYSKNVQILQNIPRRKPLKRGPQF